MEIDYLLVVLRQPVYLFAEWLSPDSRASVTSSGEGESSGNSRGCSSPSFDWSIGHAAVAMVLPHPVYAGVGGYLSQPTSQAGRSRVRADELVGLQKDILGYVFRIHAVSNHTGNVPKNLLIIGGVDFSNALSSPSDALSAIIRSLLPSSDPSASVSLTLNAIRIRTEDLRHNGLGEGRHYGVGRLVLYRKGYGEDGSLSRSRLEVDLAVQHFRALEHADQAHLARAPKRSRGVRQFESLPVVCH